MTETVVIGDATLYLGDCREILPTLGKVDAVVTDPPYGVGFKYESHVDDPQTYPEFIWPIIEAAERLVLPGGPVFVWQAQAWFPHFHRIFPRDWRIFVAAKNFVQMRPTIMQHAYEPIVVWWTEGDREEWGKDLGLVKRDFFVADSASQVLRTRSLEKGHPCPRQIDHCEYIVGVWTRPHGIVLDPFMGAATIGVAAVSRGRKYIGIEIEPKYFDIACRRIEQAYAQPDMLIERPPEPKQEPLFAEAAE